MTNLCFHIGYHKTGSTTLQLHGFSLNKELQLLSNSNPEFERQWHHHVVAAGDFLFDKDIVKDLLDSALQQHPGKSAYIISDESLSGHGFTGANARRTADRLHSIKPNAKIFLIIRNQISYIRSVYASYVFEGGSQTFPFWIADHKYPITSIYDKLQYNHLISHYIQLFGVQNVLVLPFELFETEGLFGILTRLYYFLGLEWERTNQDSENSKIRFRASLSNNTLLLFRLLNGLRGGASLNQRRVMKLANDFLLSKVPQIDIFNSINVTEIENFFRESNKRTSSLIHFDLSQFGYQM